LADEIEKDKETDIILYTFYYYKKEGEVIRKNVPECSGLWQKEQKKDLYERMLFSSDFTSIWSKAIRTSILQEDNTPYDLYIGKNMGEDLLQSLYPLTVAKKIRFIDEALYCYRINDSGVSRSFQPETIAKKNMLHVYDKISEYLQMWDMRDTENIMRLDARWFNDTMYMFAKYYEGASTKEDKKAVQEYDWKSMLPGKDVQLDNPYMNVAYKKLYEAWRTKDNKAIKKYFRKKKYYGMLKKWKRKLFS
jgi:hypothetical protein